MKDVILEMFILVIGSLMLLFIICNLKTQKNTPKENFEIDKCTLTQSEYNSLKQSWNNAHSNNTATQIEKSYEPKLDKLTTKLSERVATCYDNDKSLSKDSKGDCPNCNYVKNLFGHLDFNSDHDLGFGPLQSYCPNSLNAPGAQVCLYSLKNNMADISKLTSEQIQQLTNDLKTSNGNINATVSTLAPEIEKKIKRDYVDGFLKYHQPFELSVYATRKSMENHSSIPLHMQPPTIEIPKEHSIMETAYAANQMNKLAMKNLNIFGKYKMDTEHLKQIVRTNNNNGNSFVSDYDLNKIANSTITIGDGGITIEYTDGTEPYIFTTDDIEVIKNPYNQSIDGYRLFSINDTYDLFKVDESKLYISVFHTKATKSYLLLKDFNYLLNKLN